MRLPVNELGQRRPSFSRPDVPAPEVAGTCAKCRGHTRAEEFDSWKGGEYSRKRTYRCIQHGTKCPAYTVVIGQDGQEEGTVAKTKAGVVTCAQTREWCEAQKAAIVKKHLAYKEVAAAASVSASALAQGLNMHMSLSEATQGRIEQAIAGADAAVAQKVRKERASRKPKGYVDSAPASLSAEAVGRALKAVVTAGTADNRERIAANLDAPASETIRYDVEPPKLGFLPGVLQTEMIEHNAENIQLAIGTGAVRPPVCLCGAWATEMGGRCAPCQRVHDVDRRLTGLEEAVGEILADHVEGRVHTASRYQELEDRITQTYDHLTEHMGNLQPLVVTPPPEQADWSLLEGIVSNARWNPDRLVQELSHYSDSQLAALVNAATARREMLKAMEAA